MPSGVRRVDLVRALFERQIVRVPVLAAEISDAVERHEFPAVVRLLEDVGAVPVGQGLIAARVRLRHFQTRRLKRRAALVHRGRHGLLGTGHLHALVEVGRAERVGCHGERVDRFVLVLRHVDEHAQHVLALAGKRRIYVQNDRVGLAARDLVLSAQPRRGRVPRAHESFGFRNGK